MKLHIGYQPHEKRVKFAEDVDTLPADCRYLGNFEQAEIFPAMLHLLEEIGVQVCVDTSYGLYETAA